MSMTNKTEKASSLKARVIKYRNWQNHDAKKRKNLKLKLKSPEIQNQFECSGTSEFKIYLKQNDFCWNWKNSKLIWKEEKMIQKLFEYENK